MASAAMLLSLAAHAGSQGIWEFRDHEGVLHIGNASPSAGPGLIWLDRLRPAAAADTEVRRSAMPRAGDRVGPPEPLRRHLEEAARSAAVEPALVMAVAAAESAFDPEAVSPKGALGLMQVMPATAQRYGVVAVSVSGGRHAALDPKLNAEVGTRYLADLLRRFDGDKELALAAYNAGEGAVLRYGRRIPPYPETQKYVEKVMLLYEAWR